MVLAAALPTGTVYSIIIYYLQWYTAIAALVTPAWGTCAAANGGGLPERVI